MGRPQPSAELKDLTHSFESDGKDGQSVLVIHFYRDINQTMKTYPYLKTYPSDMDMFWSDFLYILHIL